MRQALLFAVARTAASRSLFRRCPRRPSRASWSSRAWRSTRTPCCARSATSTRRPGSATPPATAARRARSPTSTARHRHPGSFRDNTPDGMTVDTNHQIADWEVIHLAPTSRSTTCCPAARCWSPIPRCCPRAGMPVCHFGVVTGESCGTVESVNNGWFTMTNGVVSQKGDSGGPVYTPTPDGRAVLDRSVQQHLGHAPRGGVMAVASEQARADTFSAASATVGPASAPNAAARTPGSTARPRAIRSAVDFGRQTTDVAFHLPVPPVQVALEQLGLRLVGHLDPRRSVATPPRAHLDHAHRPGISRPLGVAPRGHEVVRARRPSSG